MLLREKAEQAHALLEETGLDCWLTFVRESEHHPDPGMDLVVGADVTWISAFLLTRDGRRVAVVGRYDVSTIKRQGVFDEVVGYDEGVRTPFLDVLSRLNPASIGLNYATDNYTADGLTHGMWLLLQDLLRDTPYASRLTSAAPLLARLRARKTPAEVARIRTAVATTEDIVAQTTAQIRPGVSETDLAAFVHGEFRRHGVAPAWPWEACPIVNVGPESEPGHARPQSHLRVEPGHLVHIDLGVRQDGFCSDLQRMWYVCRPGESGPPAPVRRAWDVVRAAIEAGAKALRPGVRGHEVDAVGRRVIDDAGYPDFKHGFGHGLGRAVHDGGTLLGPRWEKYGKMPEGIVEPGNVFTLELGVPTEAGFVGLEEDVVVTEKGCEFLSTFPGDVTLVRL